MSRLTTFLKYAGTFAAGFGAGRITGNQIPKELKENFAADMQWLQDNPGKAFALYRFMSLLSELENKSYYDTFWQKWASEPISERKAIFRDALKRSFERDGNSITKDEQSQAWEYTNTAEFDRELQKIVRPDAFLDMTPATAVALLRGKSGSPETYMLTRILVESIALQNKVSW